MELINEISDILQKLLKYFNGKTIFVFSTKLFPSATSAVFPTRTVLYLNNLELLVVKSTTLTGTSCLLNYHRCNWCNWIIITIFNQIVYRHCNVNMICFINKHIIKFCFLCRKWCAIFICNICTVVCRYCYIACN